MHITLSLAGQSVTLEAWGTTATNGNTKTMRLYFGATAVQSVSGAFSNTPWWLTATVYRTGAATQDAVAEGRVTTTQGVTFTTPTETLSGAVTVKITGQNGTAAANDIVCEGFRVRYH